MKRVSLLVVVAYILTADGLVAQWRVDRVRDPITDADESAASVGANQGDARLVVRCTEKPGPGVEIIFAFDEYMGRDDSDVRLRYRVDQKPATPWLQVSPSTEGTGLFVDVREAWTLLMELKAGSLLTAEAADFRGTPHLVRFSLSGSANAIDALDDCMTSRGAYAIYFPDTPELASRALLAPRMLEVGCDPWLYVSGGSRRGEVHLARGAETWSVSERKPLYGADAKRLVEILTSRTQLSAYWSRSDRPVQRVTLNEGGNLAAQVAETVRGCDVPMDDLDPKLPEIKTPELPSTVP